MGCLLQSCQLCKHNPSRRCAVNFDKKYLVNDILKAKCQAVIRVEIVERNSNLPIEINELRDEMILQMSILDGNSYDSKFEAGLESDFESCLLLMNNKVCPIEIQHYSVEWCQPPHARVSCLIGVPTNLWKAWGACAAQRAGATLAPAASHKPRCSSQGLMGLGCLQSSPTLVGTGVSNDQHGFVRVPLTSSRAVLPDLRVTDSSEAMLSGRKPPLRLMMRAVYKDTLQPVLHIRHAISEGFVVAVRCLSFRAVPGSMQGNLLLCYVVKLAFLTLQCIRGTSCKRCKCAHV